MGRQVVGDDVDLATGRLRRDDLAQKLDERRAGVTGHGRASTSPDAVLSAANSDSVPWRKYSNP